MYAANKRMLGPEYTDTLDTAGDLANFLYNHRKYAEAEQMQREVHEEAGARGRAS